MDANSPTVGEKSSWHRHQNSAHENRADANVSIRRVSSSPSLKDNISHNSNSPLKAPMSLSEQGIGSLWVFSMGMELHRQREEVGKVCYEYGCPHAKDLTT